MAPLKSSTCVRPYVSKSPSSSQQAGVTRGEGTKHIAKLTRSFMPPLCEEGRWATGKGVRLVDGSGQKKTKNDACAASSQWLLVHAQSLFPFIDPLESSSIISTT